MIKCGKCGKKNVKKLRKNIAKLHKNKPQIYNSKKTKRCSYFIVFIMNISKFKKYYF